MSIIEEKETRERLLKNVKKECKQLMEVAVTRKFINEDNSCINSLCSTIDSCLVHGLKRRSIGLFKSSSSLSLIQKISKECEQAAKVLKMCDEYDRAYCTNNPPSQSNTSQTRGPSSNNQAINCPHSFSPAFTKGSNCYKFLWIRLSLLNKLLLKIIEHIVANSSKYYFGYALAADPVDGPIFGSLLIGPCTLEYTRIKTYDNFCADPNADELIQRHRMHSGVGPTLSSSGGTTQLSTNMPLTRSRLGLNASLINKRKASANSSTALEDISNTTNNLSTDNQLYVNSNSKQPYNSNWSPGGSPNPFTKENNPYYTINGNTATVTSTYSPKEYVESLHQNSRSQIIYGKNHVVVHQKGTEFAGYLSLHLNHAGLILKWTPNQLMNVTNSSFEDPSVVSQLASRAKSGYWDLALHVDINTIVYLHCHQLSATVVLVAQDGVQYPPIKFPKGSHLLQFLTCLETGLMPNGQLDPPLWTDFGKGKVFPKLKRRSMKKSSQSGLLIDENEENSQTDSIYSQEDDQEDFVFRIVNSKSNISVTTIQSKEKKPAGEFKMAINENDSSLNGIVGANLINSIFTRRNNKLSSFFKFGSQQSKNSVDTNTLPPSIVLAGSISSLNTISSIPSPPPPTLSSQSSYSQSIDAYSISPLIIESLTNDSMIKGQTDDLGGTVNQSTKLYKSVSVRSSLKTLCDNMRIQILSRAFYGWLAYHRHLKIVRKYLVGLINEEPKMIESSEIIESDSELSTQLDSYIKEKKKLDEEMWESLRRKKLKPIELNQFHKLVYFNGIDSKMRKIVWPFLLEHYSFDMSQEEIEQKERDETSLYYKLIDEWKPLEEYIVCVERKKSIKAKKLLQEIANAKLAKQLNEKTAAKTENQDEADKKKDQDQQSNAKSNNNKRPGMSKKGSFFAFNFLNKKQAKLNLIRQDSINQATPGVSGGDMKLLKEASLNNDVFMDATDSPSSITTNDSESSSTFSIISKFSTKNLFAKLMQRSYLVGETLPETPHDVASYNEEDMKELAKEIVDQVLTNSIKRMYRDYNDEEEKPELQSEASEYLDTVNTFSRSNTLDTETGSITDTNNSSDIDLHDSVKKSVSANLKKLQSSLSQSTINQQASTQPTDTPISQSQSTQSLKMKAQYGQETIDLFALNMHRIDKDVTRCDRNYWYFMSNENLQKLKNIMYTYIWENLSIGYIQGMCDLIAPLLVIFDDEPLTYSCFVKLMKRMSSNFPHGTAMDQHFTNMRTMIQILDPDLFEHMQKRGDYTHFYFSYRWFLLDFKRELVYDDVFAVWETIWAAKFIYSASFHLFVGLSLVETYRDIIVENNMDFTDIIKFFNEMAEKHNIEDILELARQLVQQIHDLIYTNDDQKN